MNFKEIFKPIKEEELRAKSLKKIATWKEQALKRALMHKNPDGSYDVEGNIDCSGLSIVSLTDLGIKINQLDGDFNCSHNRLKDLKGAPRSVTGSMFCMSCGLDTLEGAPESVGGDFSCSENQLTTLEGAPKSVKVAFDCSLNALDSLEGAPKSVGCDFYVGDQKMARNIQMMI